MEEPGERGDVLSIKLNGGVSDENNLRTGTGLAGAKDDLSPTTEENLGLLRTDLKTRNVILKRDHQGKLHIEYDERTRKVYMDEFYTNNLCAPQPGEDLKKKFEVFFLLVEFLKKNKSPAGIVVDKSKVSCDNESQYRQGHEFEKLNETLGKGNSSEGDIFVIKDKKPGVKHAVKKVMVCTFRCDEIRCWIDLNDTGHVPQLYLVRLMGNKIDIHMEALESAKTFSSIIDEHMAALRDPENTKYVKPFSLYILKGSLEAISAIHTQGWTHNDVHSENAMLGTDMKMKIIDFGQARKLRADDGTLRVPEFQEDIAGLLRIYIGLYTAHVFKDNWDMQENYSHIIEKDAIHANFSKDDREEFKDIVEMAMKISHPDDMEEYKAKIEKYLQKAIEDSKVPISEWLTIVGSLLFPESFFQEIHKQVNLQDSIDSMGASVFQNKDIMVSEEKLSKNFTDMCFNGDAQIQNASRTAPDPKQMRISTYATPVTSRSNNQEMTQETTSGPRDENRSVNNLEILEMVSTIKNDMNEQHRKISSDISGIGSKMDTIMSTISRTAPDLKQRRISTYATPVTSRSNNQETTQETTSGPRDENRSVNNFEILEMVSTIKNDMNEQHRQVSSNISGICSKMDTIMSTISDLKSDNERLMQDSIALKQQVGSMQQKLDHIENQ